MMCPICYQDTDRSRWACDGCVEDLEQLEWEQDNEMDMRHDLRADKEARHGRHL